jgi:competence ComEA-like helix-hairpin-helix protein
MRLKQAIQEYFAFSRGELRGITVLMSVLAVVCGIRICLPSERKLEPDDFSQFSEEIRLFEAELENRIQTQDKKQPSSGLMIELNAADTLDLQRLHGIGPSFARRITGYREKLGGFCRKEQLLEVWGMDSSRYLRIAGFLSVDPAKIRKIPLNTVAFKDLIRHPYMPFEAAKAWILYRKRHTRVSAVDELKEVQGFSDSTFRKLLPYLSLD